MTLNARWLGEHDNIIRYIHPKRIGTDSTYIYTYEIKGDLEHGTMYLVKRNCSNMSYVDSYNVDTLSIATSMGICSDMSYLYCGEVMTHDYTGANIEENIVKYTFDFEVLLKNNIRETVGDADYGLTGLCTDGTYLYATAIYNNSISKYLLSDLSYVDKVGPGEYYNTPPYTQNIYLSPIAVCTDGTYLWTLEDSAFGYYPNYQNRFQKRLCSDLSLVDTYLPYMGYGIDNFGYPPDICTDGTYLYILDSGRLHKRLCSDWSYVSEVVLPVGTHLGICIDKINGYLYITCLSSNIEKRLCSDLSLVSTHYIENDEY